MVKTLFGSIQGWVMTVLRTWKLARIGACRSLPRAEGPKRNVARSAQTPVRSAAGAARWPQTPVAPVARTAHSAWRGRLRPTSLTGLVLPGLVLPTLVLVGLFCGLPGAAWAASADPAATHSPTIAQARHPAAEFFDYAEWTFANPNFSGNPHDLEAEAEFIHESGTETHRQPLFYSGGQEWRLRFRHPRTGLWRFELHSPARALDGIRGSLLIRHAPGPGSEGSDKAAPDAILTLPADDRGLVVARGSQWGFANGEVFVPQYVMAGGPQYFAGHPERLAEDIRRLLVGHGFNGFHVPMYCRWFNIDKPSCAESSSADPDPRTFATLEAIILGVYRAGGVVHLWMYGDNSRFENPRFLPAEGGLNGPADRRLQNYIVARLGPLPGWTMSYGYDLFEWATPADLESWYGHMRQKMGANHHLLGARSGKNSPDQPLERADYSSYEQHRPNYSTYVETLERRPHKPSFSEDRFRVRSGYLLDDKDYDPERTRRGFYHATMAGGVGNIWGYLMGEHVTANEGLRSSGDYPNRLELLNWKRFFATRFVPDMQRCNALTSGDAACLRSTDAGLIIVYREATSELELGNLPAGRYTVLAVDTRTTHYKETPLGVVEGHGRLPTGAVSDWIIALTRIPQP